MSQRPITGFGDQRNENVRYSLRLPAPPNQFDEVCAHLLLELYDRHQESVIDVLKMQTPVLIPEDDPDGRTISDGFRPADEKGLPKTGWSPGSCENGKENSSQAILDSPHGDRKRDGGRIGVVASSYQPRRD